MRQGLPPEFEDCPSWCERDHRDVHPEDLVHASKGVFLTTPIAAWSDGRFRARSGDLVVQLLREWGARETWISVADEERGALLLIDMEQAPMLIRCISELTDVARSPGR